MIGEEKPGKVFHVFGCSIYIWWHWFVWRAFLDTLDGFWFQFGPLEMSFRKG